MKFAYLILAHNTPKIVHRLINSIDSDGCIFFLHIDKKSDLAAFFINKSNIVFIKERLEIGWGDFSVLSAIISLLHEAFTYPEKFDYFILLSGSDYPIRSAHYIENYFEQNQGKEFINCVQMPNIGAGKPLSRLTDFKITNNDSPIVKKVIYSLLRYGLIPKRNYTKGLGGLIPYGGSTWWALSREACSYVLFFTNSHPSFYNFFRRTHMSDEMYFQTILANSPYKTAICHNLTYTDWSAGGPHPAIIQKEHLIFFTQKEKLIVEDHYGKGEVLFARKFSEENIGLLDELDETINTKKANE